MSKYLIINADDFGMNHSCNQAVFELFKCGGITSATIMAPCGWAFEAGKWAAENPEFCVGVHLTFTNEWGRYKWGPVSNENLTSLINELGYMHSDCDDVEKNTKPDEILKELLAQIELVEKFGVKLAHVDNHMGSLYGSCGIQSHLPIVFEVCAKRGFGFRIPKYFTPDDEGYNKYPPQIINLLCETGKMAEQAGVYVLDRMIQPVYTKEVMQSYESFRSYYIDVVYSGIKDGINENYIHPNLPEEEVKAITGSWGMRNWEYEVHKDPKTRQHLESKGVKLISWRDVKLLREQGV